EQRRDRRQAIKQRPGTHRRHHRHHLGHHLGHERDHLAAASTALKAARFSCASSSLTLSCAHCSWLTILVRSSGNREPTQTAPVSRMAALTRRAYVDLRRSSVMLTSAPEIICAKPARAFLSPSSRIGV